MARRAVVPEAAASTVLDSLLQRPAVRRPAASQSHYHVAAKNALHQLDLLELPADHGRRYALVLVDVATRTVAARALTNKRAETVAAAIRDIYEHNDLGLTWPTVASVDAGSEFRGATAAQFAEHGAEVKVGVPGRHAQQSYVENANKELGQAAFARQHLRELASGHTNREWVATLPEDVAALNRRWVREPTPLPGLNALPPQRGKDKVVLDIGTPVRVRLDRPVDVNGRLLPGQHRAADIWWTPEVHTVTGVVNLPGNSLRYEVSGIPNASYSPYELQVLTPAQVAAQRVLDAARVARA